MTEKVYVGNMQRKDLNDQNNRSQEKKLEVYELKKIFVFFFCHC